MRDVLSWGGFVLALLRGAAGPGGVPSAGSGQRAAPGSLLEVVVGSAAERPCDGMPRLVQCMSRGRWPWSVVLLRGRFSPGPRRTIPRGDVPSPLAAAGVLLGELVLEALRFRILGPRGAFPNRVCISGSTPRRVCSQKRLGQGRSCPGAGMSCQRRVSRWIRFVGLRARGHTVGGYRVVLGSVLEAVWSGLLPGGRVMVRPPLGCSAPGRLRFRVAPVIGWPAVKASRPQRV